MFGRRRESHARSDISLISQFIQAQTLARIDTGRPVPYDELPTDVQDLTATDPEFLRMSDEDVEKAIDEIKAALRKNAPQQR